MKRSRWERVERICWAALELSDDERGQFVDAECAGDADLRDEVTALLRQIGSKPDFLEEPIVKLPDLVAPETAPASTPTFIGSYRVVRPLGRGGMGEVYLAVHEGEDFQVHVAIKVIKRGMDTDEVLQRFRLERQILASLRHPNIAQLLDGGITDDGRPFFVMEYVEGMPLTEHCDGERRSVRERLILFQRICAAVQHAHQNLVVHRDLKPGNILVTSDGIPKLLDFGIGKVLAAAPDHEQLPQTRTDVRLLTPGYAAPEQVRGETPTTATDVYGLGVLLYELLTGRLPFGGAHDSPLEVERAICEDPPTRPSVLVGRTGQVESTDEPGATHLETLCTARRTDPARLRRTLAGDLDTIILKALSKEPDRRYPSAAAFAEDIARHLVGQPVLARPATVVYRAGRFVRRHTWGVATAAVVILALIGFTAQTLVQSERLRQERDKAQNVSGFLLEMFGAAGADQAAADTVTARQLLDRQADAVRNGYENQLDLKAQMMHVIAEGYERLGLLADAEPLAREALALRRQLHGDRHPDVATSLNTLGWIRYTAGDWEEALTALEEAVTILRRAGRRERGRLSRALNDLGVVLDDRGRAEEAAAVFREALDFRRTELGPDHRAVGITANNLAANLYRRGDYAGAAESGREAVRALRNSVGPDHQRTVIAQSNLIVFLEHAGDVRGAVEQRRELLDRQTRLQGPDHPVRALMLNQLGTLLRHDGQAAEAEPLHREALRIAEANFGPNHANVADALEGIGAAVGEVEGAAAGIPYLQRALEINQAVYGDVHRITAETMLSLGVLQRAMGDLETAERSFRRAIAVLSETVGEEHLRTSVARNHLGSTLLDQGRPAEALVEATAAHRATLAQLPNGHNGVHNSRILVIRAHLAVGDTAVADSLLAVIRAGLDAGEGDDAIRRMVEELTAAR